jgi:hypothetical protein
MLLRTRELSVSARKTPSNKVNVVKRTALSKISDSSPPESPQLTSSKSSGSASQHHQIQVEDELRFKQNEDRSSLAKEFANFNLESYSEYHRPSDISDDYLQDHGAPGGGGGGGGGETSQGYLSPPSSKINSALSSTFPPRDLHSHLDPVSPLAASSSSSSSFTPLSRMSPVKRQYSDEIAAEHGSVTSDPSLSSNVNVVAADASNSTINSEAKVANNKTKTVVDKKKKNAAVVEVEGSGGGEKKNTQQIVDEYRSSEFSLRSSKIKIPVLSRPQTASGSSGHSQRTPPRSSHRSGGGYGSFVSNHSLSSTYSYASHVAPPLPLTPPPLPQKEDILALMLLFEQDISSLLFPQIVNSFPPSSLSRSSSTSTVPYDTIRTNLYLSGLLLSADELIGWIQPTTASLIKRKAVFEWVEQLVKQSLGAQLLSIGSFPQRTYLPESDQDVSAMLISGQEDSWFVKVSI